MNTVSYFNDYEVKIIKRNLIYPFTNNFEKVNINNSNVESVKNYESCDFKSYNDFVKLPVMSNLYLDNNGLPFIPR